MRAAVMKGIRKPLVVREMPDPKIETRKLKPGTLVSRTLRSEDVAEVLASRTISRRSVSQ